MTEEEITRRTVGARLAQQRERRARERHRLADVDGRSVLGAAARGREAAPGCAVAPIRQPPSPIRQLPAPIRQPPAPIRQPPAPIRQPPSPPRQSPAPLHPSFSAVTRFVPRAAVNHSEMVDRLQRCLGSGHYL